MGGQEALAFLPVAEEGRKTEANEKVTLTSPPHTSLPPIHAQACLLGSPYSPRSTRRDGSGSVHLWVLHFHPAGKEMG